MNPKVSIAMPVYNREKYVAQSIESVLNQTFTDFELLICDDGSTDSTWSVLENYACKDKRVKLFRNKTNLGISKTLNKLISHSEGEYLARQDSDDLWLKGKLKMQVDFLDNNKDYDVVDGKCKFINSKGRKKLLYHYHMQIFGHVNEYLNFQCFVLHSCVLIRLQKLISLFPNGNIYRKDFDGIEDYDLWSRVINDIKFYKLPRVLFLYRIHEQSSWSTQKQNVRKNFIENAITITHKNIHKNYNIDVEDNRIIWVLYHPYNLAPLPNLKITKKSFEIFTLENKNIILQSRGFKDVIFLAVIYQVSLGNFIFGIGSLRFIFQCFRFELVRKHIFNLAYNLILNWTKIFTKFALLGMKNVKYDNNN